MNYKKKNSNEYKYLKRLITRILISIIIVLSVGISIKLNNDNSYYVQKYLFLDSIKFTKIKNLYESQLGKLIPEVKVNSQMVFNGSDFFSYPKEQYEEGAKISVSKNEVISSLQSGIIVYIGDKDKYNNTIIVQGNDGIDYWYGNIDNVNINLYDYITKDTILGNSKDNYIYLVLKNGNEIVKYDEFIKKNKN